VSPAVRGRAVVVVDNRVTEWYVPVVEHGGADAGKVDAHLTDSEVAPRPL